MIPLDKLVERLMKKIKKHNEGIKDPVWREILDNFYLGEVYGMKRVIELVYDLRLIVEADTHGTLSLCVRTKDKKKMLYSSLDPGAMFDCLEAYEKQWLEEPEREQEETHTPFDEWDEDDSRMEILK